MSAGAMARFEDLDDEAKDFVVGFDVFRVGLTTALDAVGSFLDSHPDATKEEQRDLIREILINSETAFFEKYPHAAKVARENKHVKKLLAQRRKDIEKVLKEGER